MHWNLGQIYLHLKSNTKLTTLPTLCDTGKLDGSHSHYSGNGCHPNLTVDQRGQPKFP